VNAPLPVPQQEVIMKLRLQRVFVLRIWVGVRLLKLAIFVLGGTADVANE
jgi:hypothetical protein